MPQPPSDPNGSSPPPAATGDGAPAPRRGSTSAHHPSPGNGHTPSLSDLLRAGSGSSRRVPSASDIAHHLASPVANVSGSDVNLLNTDESPTVITHPGQIPQGPPPPPPPYVVGDSPSVAGRRLGHFELIEAVGSGGMAAVLRARDQELGRIVALKILPPEATRDPENVTRFKQEARAAARLDHENIARVYFCGEDQGLHFIAFEFVEGITLRQMIDRRGPLPAGECLRYMVQIAAGLAHASERGVVHRDIKPSNIIITPDRRAKIVDMGLARHLDSATVNGGLTQSGVTLGTFDYISPEQALDPRRADVRSDIYSLGCAFYHALTGRTPVPEGTAAKKLHAHQHVDPLDPRELNRSIPDDVAAVLARMMAKDPARRYQSPAELIANLKGVADKLHLSLDGAVADSAVRAVAADPNVLSQQPRLPLGWIVGLSGVAIAVVALVMATSGPGPERADRGPILGKQRQPTNPTPPDPGTKAGTPVPLAGRPIDVNSAQELADALAKPTTTKVQLLPGEKYDLAKLGTKVKHAGPSLEMIGSADRPPTVIVTADAFALQTESVALSGIRFEVISATDSKPPQGWQVIGVRILGATRIDLVDCLFLPLPAATAGENRLVSVEAVGSSPEHLAEVNVRRCLFGPGRGGISVPVGTKLRIEDSGFGPNDAAVSVVGTVQSPHGEVTLDRVSFMVEPGDAVVDTGDTPTTIRAGHCVFSAAGASPTEAPRKGVVIRVNGVPPRGTRFETPAKNAYYEVDPYGAEDRTFSFERVQELRLPYEDKDRVMLKKRPWDAAPGGVLSPFDTNDPYRAFRLRIADAEVFAGDDEEPRVFGARFQRGTARLAYKSWPPAKPAPTAAEHTEKTWDPKGKDDPRTGHYTDLVKLLRDVRSGDTVLIVGDGPVEIEKAEIKSPNRTDKSEFKLTFKPAPGSRPVLVCSPFNIELDTALFRLFDGEVEFQDLHFQVRPTAERESLAAVGVLGGRRCTFTRCAFDLDENGKSAAAVSLSDPKAKMMLSPGAGRTVPRVEFDRCLIRGRGRAVAVADGLPFDLDLRDSVTAVYGPVLLVNGAGKDLAGAPRASVVKLTRTTALLGGPAIELHAVRVGEMRTHGLAPLDVSADNCLFAAVPNTGRSLVELNGIDPKDVSRGAENSPLRWSTTKGSRYANFDPAMPAMLVRPASGDAEVKWDWSKWVGFAGEPADRQPVGTVTFANGPTSASELGAVVPMNAALKAVDFPDLTDPNAADVGPLQLRDVAPQATDEVESDTP